VRGNEVYGCGLHHSSNPNVVRADVADWRQLEFALDDFDPIGKNFDLFFHLAGEFGRRNGQAYPEYLWRTNCAGTRQVIAQCCKRNIPLVFASSSEAYGLSELYNNNEPLREEMLDNHVPQFHNEYALSKWVGERQIHTAVRNHDLKAIILRFFNVYGPPERYTPYRSVVCQFAWKLLNNQSPTINREGKRSHLWIEDWANTVANIAQEGRLNSMLGLDKVWSGAGGTKGVPVFNIGGTCYESVEELYNRLREIIPDSKSPIIYQDTEPANSATKQPNCVKAEVYLDHFPVMPLQAGLEETVEFLRMQMRYQ
jgi:dTDP-glucose 4,6-dehydratase